MVIILKKSCKTVGTFTPYYIFMLKGGLCHRRFDFVFEDSRFFLSYYPTSDLRVQKTSYWNFRCIVVHKRKHWRRSQFQLSHESFVTWIFETCIFEMFQIGTLSCKSFCSLGNLKRHWNQKVYRAKLGLSEKYLSSYSCSKTNFL